MTKPTLPPLPPLSGNYEEPEPFDASRLENSVPPSVLRLIEANAHKIESVDVEESEEEDENGRVTTTQRYIIGLNDAWRCKHDPYGRGATLHGDVEGESATDLRHEFANVVRTPGLPPYVAPAVAPTWAVAPKVAPRPQPVRTDLVDEYHQMVKDGYTVRHLTVLRRFTEQECQYYAEQTGVLDEYNRLFRVGLDATRNRLLSDATGRALNKMRELKIVGRDVKDYIDRPTEEQVRAAHAQAAISSILLAKHQQQVAQSVAQPQSPVAVRKPVPPVAQPVAQPFNKNDVEGLLNKIDTEEEGYGLLSVLDKRELQGIAAKRRIFNTGDGSIGDLKRAIIGHAMRMVGYAKLGGDVRPPVDKSNWPKPVPAPPVVVRQPPVIVPTDLPPESSASRARRERLEKAIASGGNLTKADRERQEGYARLGSEPGGPFGYVPPPSPPAPKQPVQPPVAQSFSKKVILVDELLGKIDTEEEGYGLLSTLNKQELLDIVAIRRISNTGGGSIDGLKRAIVDRAMRVVRYAKLGGDDRPPVDKSKWPELIAQSVAQPFNKNDVLDLLHLIDTDEEGYGLLSVLNKRELQDIAAKCSIFKTGDGSIDGLKRGIVDYFSRMRGYARTAQQGLPPRPPVDKSNWPKPVPAPPLYPPVAQPFNKNDVEKLLSSIDTEEEGYGLLSVLDKRELQAIVGKRYYPVTGSGSIDDLKRAIIKNVMRERGYSRLAGRDRPPVDKSNWPKPVPAPPEPSVAQPQPAPANVQEVAATLLRPAPAAPAAPASAAAPAVSAGKPYSKTVNAKVVEIYHMDKGIIALPTPLNGSITKSGRTWTLQTDDGGIYQSNNAKSTKYKQYRLNISPPVDGVYGLLVEVESML